MTPLTITMNIDEKPWEDAKGAPCGFIERIARVPNGTTGGASAVAILILLPDGSHVIGHTTMNLLLSAAKAFGVKEQDQLSAN